MTLLIDGHNLINALPDIDLDDPNDEAKLVEKLKGYCGRVRKKAVVVFDHGLPGGQSHDLSTGQVKVIFAAAHRTNADRVIRARLRKGHPGQFTVVSSDHEVQNAAYAARMLVLTSQAFADKMFDAMVQASPSPEVAPDVNLSKAEVDEWLDLFGKDVDDA